MEEWIRAYQEMHRELDVDRTEQGVGEAELERERSSPSRLAPMALYRHLG